MNSEICGIYGIVKLACPQHFPRGNWECAINAVAEVKIREAHPSHAATPRSAVELAHRAATVRESAK